MKIGTQKIFTLTEDELRKAFPEIEGHIIYMYHNEYRKTLEIHTEV